MARNINGRAVDRSMMASAFRARKSDRLSLGCMRRANSAQACRTLWGARPIWREPASGKESAHLGGLSSLRVFRLALICGWTKDLLDGLRKIFVTVGLYEVIADTEVACPLLYALFQARREDHDGDRR